MKNLLTPMQTETLKQLRKKVSEIEALAEHLSDELCMACDCDMKPDDCYICALLSTVYDLQPIAGQLGIRLDSALEGKEFPEWSEVEA